MTRYPNTSMRLSSIVVLMTLFGFSGCAGADGDAAPHSAVTVVYEGLELHVTTDRSIVGEVLRDNRIDVYPEDLVIPELTEPVHEGQVIVIDPAYPVTITNFYGDDSLVRTRAKTVGSLMGEIGYEPTPDEQIKPDVENAITPDLHIYLIRTKHDLLEVDVPVPYSTTYERDTTKDFTFRSVTQEGVDGIKKRSLKLSYENDVLVSKTIVSEEITQEPQDEIIAIGTRTPPGGTNLGRVTSSFYGTAFHGRRTASGETFDKNSFTAAHPTLPFGTTLKVTNTANGESVVVRVTDRGPYHSNRGLDLSEAAFAQISHLGAGVITVELEVVTAKSLSKNL